MLCTSAKDEEENENENEKEKEQANVNSHNNVSRYLNAINIYFIHFKLIVNACFKT